MLAGNHKEAIKVKMVRHDKTPCLVASFPSSEPPMVWQFDLNKNDSFTLLLKESEGAWGLGFAETGKSFVPVARFHDIDDAEAAYAAVQKALLRQEPLLKSPWWRLAVVVMWALLIALFAQDVYIGMKNARLPQQAGQTATQPGMASAPVQKDEMKPGVPVSADDVLQSPP